MKLSTDVLWKWLASTGRTIAMGSDRQGEVTVPNQLIATFPPYGPILKASAGTLTAPLRESTVFDSLTLVAPSTASQTPVQTGIGRGAWRLTAAIEVMADFSNGSAGAADPLVRLQLIAPGGSLVSLLNVLNQANVPNRTSGTWDLVLPVDTWGLQFFLSATAAAQNYIASLTCQINRLS